MEIGSKVRVKPPFDEALPGEYLIEVVANADDGQPIIYLAGIESAFSPDNLELIE